MQLKNIKGAVIAADLPEETLKLMQGIVFDKDAATTETFAVVNDEAAFIANMNESLIEMKTAKDTPGTPDEAVKNYEASIAAVDKFIAGLDLVPVYDAEGKNIDSVMPDDTGHIAYEPVKDANGAVTHFIIKPAADVLPEAEKTYSIIDYKENVIGSITEADAEKNELLIPFYDDGELQGFHKTPEFIFNCSPVIGLVRIAAKDKAEALDKLSKITLKDYISRDNTKLSFIE